MSKNEGNKLTFQPNEPDFEADKKFNRRQILKSYRLYTSIT